jgi:hypothetical protein
MMRHQVLVTICWLGLVASAAQADAPPPPPAGAPTAVEESGRWSFGGGVGLASYEVISLSGLGSRSALGSLRGPVGVALIERSLGPAWRLGANVLGSYTRSETDDEADAPGIARDRHAASRVSGGVSLRWVLNPGQLVEVSPMLALGGGWLREEGATRGVSYSENAITGRRQDDSKGWGVDGRLGLVVEYRLLTRLYLRLESHFFRVGLEHQRVTTRDTSTDAPPETSHADLEQFGVSLGFQPLLQLRIVL